MDKKLTEKWTKNLLHTLKKIEQDVADGAPLGHKKRHLKGLLTSFAEEVIDSLPTTGVFTGTAEEDITHGDFVSVDYKTGGIRRAIATDVAPK